jgi:hypothetical protein
LIVKFKTSHLIPNPSPNLRRRETNQNKKQFPLSSDEERRLGG